MLKSFRAALALAFAAAAITATPAQAGILQCVPFARQLSGISLFGNAKTWWAQAAGRFARGHEPRIGAVLSFAASRAMPLGHVAVVSKVVSPREVLISHANWSSRGGIERNVRAVDVSLAGDWSQVRVWFARIGGLGLRTNPANGFIYASKADTPAPTDGLKPLETPLSVQGTTLAALTLPKL